VPAISTAPMDSARDAHAGGLDGDRRGRDVAAGLHHTITSPALAAPITRLQFGDRSYVERRCRRGTAHKLMANANQRTCLRSTDDTRPESGTAGRPAVSTLGRRASAGTTAARAPEDCSFWLSGLPRQAGCGSTRSRSCLQCAQSRYETMRPSLPVRADRRAHGMRRVLHLLRWRSRGQEPDGCESRARAGRRRRPRAGQQSAQRRGSRGAGAERRGLDGQAPVRREDQPVPVERPRSRRLDPLRRELGRRR
jgi:hypothetical protein